MPLNIIVALCHNEGYTKENDDQQLKKKQLHREFLATKAILNEEDLNKKSGRSSVRHK